MIDMELAYISATLKGATATMSRKDRENALDCFHHWRDECKRIGPEDPVAVAFTVHEIIDERTARMRATSKHAPEIKCREGCAACCKLHVDIFSHEAVLLHAIAAERGIEIDMARLARQAAKNDTTWRELAPEDKRCVFLDDKDACRVYEHRPGACRKYFVISEPELCDMEKHPGGSVGVCFDVEAEIIQSAAMTVYEGGNMASMLLKHAPQPERKP